MRINEILKSQGIEPKKYSAMYDDVQLTDDEEQEALYAARKNKYYKLKLEEYWKNVYSGTGKWTGITKEQLHLKFINRIKTSIGKTPTETSKAIAAEIADYYCNPESKLLQTKGLLFVGGTGSGKTMMAKAIQDNPRYNYELTTAKNIAECYEIGDDYWSQWFDPNKAIIIDDMGDEKIAQVEYKRNQIEAIDELLKSRYDSHSYSNIIITTNLNGDAISSRYGDRLRSRMREMFNVVNYGNTDLRV